MQIKDFLAPANVLLDLRAADKARLLSELSTLAASAAKLDAGLVANAIAKREELGSTGMGGGIAIPHARFAELSKPFGLLARLQKPIDFMAIDGEPVDLVFLLLLPASTQGGQLPALACVARALRDQKIVALLRKGTSALMAYQAITSG